MPVLEVSVVMPWSVPATGPASSNKLLVNTDGVTLAGAAEDICTTIGDAYADFPRWGSLLSGEIRVTGYDAAGTAPRSPIYARSTFATVGTTSAPAPCALMVGARPTTPTEGTRKRNNTRVRLGPLTLESLDNGGHWTDDAVDDAYDLFVNIGLGLASNGYNLVAGSVASGFLATAKMTATNRVALIERRMLDATYSRTTP